MGKVVCPGKTAREVLSEVKMFGPVCEPYHLVPKKKSVPSLIVREQVKQTSIMVPIGLSFSEKLLFWGAGGIKTRQAVEGIC